MNPLNGLLCKGKKWSWTTAWESAFQEAKWLLALNKVLTHYNPKQAIRHACDGVGAVISHVLPCDEERPIAFASTTLSKAEHNYARSKGRPLAYSSEYGSSTSGRSSTMVGNSCYLPTIVFWLPSWVLKRVFLQRWQPECSDGRSSCQPIISPSSTRKLSSMLMQIDFHFDCHSKWNAETKSTLWMYSTPARWKHCPSAAGRYDETPWLTPQCLLSWKW